MNNTSKTKTTPWALFVSIFALSVSILSLWFNYKMNRQNAEATVIKETYQTFFELDKMALNNPEISHVFTTPEGYNSVFANVQTSVEKLSQNELAKIELKERALAIQIFDNYEQSLFLLDQAKRSKLKEREVFLQKVINYFDYRLLRNPRLIFYWKKLELDYEESTIQHYTKNVVVTDSSTEIILSDSIGPYRKISTIKNKN